MALLQQPAGRYALLLVLGLVAGLFTPNSVKNPTGPISPWWYSLYCRWPSFSQTAG